MADNEFYQVNLQFVSNTQVIQQTSTTINKLGKELDELGPKVRRASGFLDQLGSRLFGQLAAASLAARAIRYVGRELREFAAFDLNAPQFKENTELAYATVLGTAEKGRETFRTLDDIARRVHLPSERAHEIATHLMEQGLRDTSAVAQVIETSAALIRTGNERGAEKLLQVIDRSIARGHFGAGGKRGGQAGREFAGLGISATLAKELSSGKDTVEDGIGKISQAIQAGDIGKIARAKFDLKDFGVDLENTFRRVAQSTDVHGFDASLRRLDEAINKASADGGSMNLIFQATANVFTWVADRATEFVTGVEHLTSGLKEAIGADHEFTEGMKEIGSAIGDVLGYAGRFAAVFTIGVVEVIQTATAVAESLGAALGFLGDAIAHPFDHLGDKYQAYRKTVLDIQRDYNAAMDKENKLADDFISGHIKSADVAKKSYDHFYAEGKSLDYLADSAGKAKKALDEILGPEDLVFRTFFGALDAGADVIEAGHRGPGFANLIGMGVDPHDYYGLQSTRERLNRGRSVADIASGIGLPAGGGVPALGGGTGAPGGGKTVMLTWTGNVYVGASAEHGGVEDVHFRDLVDSALIDAFDRLRLELGA